MLYIHIYIYEFKMCYIKLNDIKILYASSVYIYIKIYQSIAIIISFYLILKKTNDRIKPKKWWKKHKKNGLYGELIELQLVVFWNMSFIFPYFGNNYPN